ncbi:hypothetical protein P5673_030365 [Acropora cervicornis]|uniref:Uncharacterized protein n=1 Tax=Acropora cervicornis TaxID=6130 RepID=A0AAD9PV66_ACRCE|nr:hypothetical protein P5673_030365 [Acropora cervicornis]
MVKGYDFSRFAFFQISPDEEDFDPRMLDQVRSKLKKRKMGNEEKDDLDEKMVKDPSTKSKQESARTEYKRLKKEMMETKRNRDKEGKKHSESKGESDVLAAFHAEQVTYLEKKKAAQKRKGEGRDEQVTSNKYGFSLKLSQASLQ